MKTGRPISMKTDRLGIRLPHDVKLALAIKALQQNTTVSRLIVAALQGQS